MSLTSEVQNSNTNRNYLTTSCTLLFHLPLNNLPSNQSLNNQSSKLNSNLSSNHTYNLQSNHLSNQLFGLTANHLSNRTFLCPRDFCNQKNKTQPNLKLMNIYRSHKHLFQIFQQTLLRSGNVESNPGPRARGDLHVVTYNVRGLGDERKLRHLLNQMHTRKGGKNTDFVACMQETYIEKPGKIPFLWRGNFHLTPGNGHSCGCLTILSPHLNVIASRELEQRGHVIACQKVGDNSITYIIANIYAPNANTAEKADFFEKVFDTILELQESYNCGSALVLGDFNLVLTESEVKNRMYTSQERRIASLVKNLLATSDMQDVWFQDPRFTWRRPGTDVFSTIDRISFTNSALSLVNVEVNWSLGFSDHAAVEAVFKDCVIEKKARSRITRLDPHLAKVEWSRLKIESDFEEMFSQTPSHWDPHMKLDYAKLCLRTVVEQVQAERKRKELNEEELLNEELDTAIKLISNGIGSHQRLGEIIEHVESLRAKKATIIEARGERLAERAGSQWYNEGEKSTRYFLRLLNRSYPDDFKSVTSAQGVVTDPEAIELEVVKFYKNLYENYDKEDLHVLEDNDEFFNELQSISDDAEQKIINPIELRDLTATLRTCRDSAPGPDGIPYSILRIVWSTYGPLLVDAWNHSLVTGKLPDSHKLSYLKLIPKQGKDASLLTNWRPITLSNCDHKLITKTYSTRMCENVAASIKGNQTAYVKGRLINDNIRAMLATVNAANVKQCAKGILVSLDAKKAFDSVEHSYIERCLKEFGCSRFIPIFRILYSDLTTNILINGRIVKGFRILRGVKQGDALSCIIFIICMEPLIRNLDANAIIRPINSVTVGNLPKVYAYADDVSCAIIDSIDSLQQVFNEYERLSKRSGLVLNADKTEIMRLGSSDELRYNVSYLNQQFLIATKEKIKINGILFQRDYKELVNENAKAAINRMDKFFRSWSRRSLSTLGRILIVKTFGISQLIFMMQSVSFDNSHYKLFNNLIYKFVWNRHYLAAKAPERIKREIMCKPIKLGGFGMLNLESLDESLKIKSISRMPTSNHPFITILAGKTSLTSYFEPSCSENLDPFHSQSIKHLRKLRDKTWDSNVVDRNRSVLAAVRNLPIKSVMSGAGSLSIPFFALRVRGKSKIMDLSEPDVRSIARHIEPKKIALITKAINLAPAVTAAPQEINLSILYNNSFKELSKCSSREIRLSLSDSNPICDYKLGAVLTPAEAINWGCKLSKLTSTKHKNIILKVAHGEVFTKLKLHRFNLIDSNSCPRCDQPEDLRHKFLNCEYIARIWKCANQYTNQLTTSNINQIDQAKVAIGSFLDSNQTILTINAEILLRISYLKDDQEYLVHPKTFIKCCLKSIARNERNKSVKEAIEALLE